MTLRVGERIIAGGGTLKDNVTITHNNNQEIQTVGKINQNTSNSATPVLYDWVGTLEEYRTQQIETEHPTWICFITDDDPSGTSNCLTLLEFKWSDKIINETSWLNADTFSWQDGRVYQTAFLHLLNDLYEEDVNLYCWASINTSKIIYTRTETPAVNSWTYDENGVRWKTINSVNGNEINVLNPTVGEEGPYIRDISGDTTITVTLGTQTTETIAGTTITYYTAMDGHRICLSDQETAVQTIYENTGVAWFYILDTTNTKFKLPRTKYGFNGLRDTVGNYVPESLPNITGAFWIDTYYAATPDGAFTATDNYSAPNHGNWAAEGWRIHLDASKSSSSYQNGAPVQPRATEMYLYFYVGEFTQSALENTAGITTETLNSKMDAANFQVVTALPANPNPNVFYFLVS